MTETDVLTLANFLVNFEILEVNKGILESNLQHFRDAKETANRQGLLLERIVALLEDE